MLEFTKEDLKVIIRDSGQLIFLSTIALIAPIIVSLLYFENPMTVMAYVVTAIVSLAIGYSFKTFWRTKEETRLKHAFISICFIWLVYVSIASLPFVIIAKVSFIDAFFEAMSLLTTTGLTTLTGVEFLPKSLLFWRSLLCWVGGLGIVVLALIGLFPNYTRTGKLMKVEGREERIKPHVKNTVKEIWKIYLILTLVGVALLLVSGMNPFDSVNYSMSAISTTGAVTSDAGLTAPHSPWINISILIIIILGATSFSVHYLAIKKKNWIEYIKNREFSAMIVLGILISLIVMPKMILFYGGEINAAVMTSFFTSFDALTEGGFNIVPPLEMARLDDFVKLMLVVAAIIGGCAGSTTGGIKISRIMLFVKGIIWRIKESVLPIGAVFSKKFEGEVVEERTISEINQFIILYIFFIVLGTIVLTFQGFEMSNALFEVASAQGNMGTTIGVTSAAMPLLSKIMLIINMLIGRLEIIPIISLIGFQMYRKKRGK